MQLIDNDKRSAESVYELIEKLNEADCFIALNAQTLWIKGIEEIELPRNVMLTLIEEALHSDNQERAISLAVCALNHKATLLESNAPEAVSFLKIDHANSSQSVRLDLQTDNIPTVSSPFNIQTARFTSEQSAFAGLKGRDEFLCNLMSANHGEFFFTGSLESFVPYIIDESPKPFYPQATLKVISVLDKASYNEQLTKIVLQRKQIGRLERPEGE